MDEEDFIIPQLIDDPPKFFFWDLDVFLLACIPFMFGLMTGQAIIGVIAGIALATFYSKNKTQRHPAFWIHALIWRFGVSLGFKRTPESAERFFQG